MANTTNLNLVKPAGTDYALVSVINGNMDIIDSKVGAIPANESAQSQITALNNQITDIGNQEVRFKQYSVPTSGLTLTLRGGTRGFIYIPAANLGAQFGLHMFVGGSTSSYTREILASSFVTVSASGGSFTFTNSSSGARTIFFITIGTLDNLPD